MVVKSLNPFQSLLNITIYLNVGLFHALLYSILSQCSLPFMNSPTLDSSRSFMKSPMFVGQIPMFVGQTSIFDGHILLFGEVQCVDDQNIFESQVLLVNPTSFLGQTPHMLAQFPSFGWLKALLLSKSYFCCANSISDAFSLNPHLNFLGLIQFLSVNSGFPKQSRLRLVSFRNLPEEF